MGEQGHAIEGLRGAMQLQAASDSVGAQVAQDLAVEEAPPAWASALPVLIERVTELEDMAESTQRQLAALAAVVRQVRDHAADAFEDRIAAAIGEMQRRLVDTVAAARNR